MAYFGAQRRIPEGQCTQTIYTLIKEQKFQEAITHLNIELQVCKQATAVARVSDVEGQHRSTGPNKVLCATLTLAACMRLHHVELA